MKRAPPAEGIHPIERRCVVDDAQKTWHNLFDGHADIYLLDFIDQRCWLLLRCDDIATLSTSTEGLVGHETLGTMNFRRLGALTPEYDELLHRTLPMFCEFLAGRERIIVNDAVWATHFEHELPMTGHWPTSSPANNRVLDKIFDCLAKRSHAVFVCLDRTRLKSSKQHRWGEAAFHYSDETEKWIG